MQRGGSKGAKELQDGYDTVEVATAVVSSTNN